MIGCTACDNSSIRRWSSATERATSAKDRKASSTRWIPASARSAAPRAASETCPTLPKTSWTACASSRATLAACVTCSFCARNAWENSSAARTGRSPSATAPDAATSNSATRSRQAATTPDHCRRNAGGNSATTCSAATRSPRANSVASRSRAIQIASSPATSAGPCPGQASATAVPPAPRRSGTRSPMTASFDPPRHRFLIVFIGSHGTLLKIHRLPSNRPEPHPTGAL